jgi:hypothetical protein
MRPETAGEVSLVKYLLGDLPEAEQVCVEDRALADGNYRTALEAAEADLIDAYVRDELSAAERRAFEQRFLGSPQRRQKVAFARDLALVAAETRAAERDFSTRLSAWQALAALVRGWSPALQLAATLAALICVVGASLVVFQNTQLRSRVASLESQGRDLQARTGNLQRQLADEQARAGNFAAQLQQQQPAGAARTSSVASLVLLPGLTRADSRREQLVLNPAAQIAHIEIQLEPRDDYQRFRAELRTLGGEEILIRGSLPKRAAAAGYLVSFDVPATALATGQYELTLSGLSNQSVQEIGYYYFSVEKQP